MAFEGHIQSDVLSDANADVSGGVKEKSEIIEIASEQVGYGRSENSVFIWLKELNNSDPFFLSRGRGCTTCYWEVLQLTLALLGCIIYFYHLCFYMKHLAYYSGVLCLERYPICFGL